MNMSREHSKLMPRWVLSKLVFKENGYPCMGSGSVKNVSAFLVNVVLLSKGKTPSLGLQEKKKQTQKQAKFEDLYCFELLLKRWQKIHQWCLVVPIPLRYLYLTLLFLDFVKTIISEEIVKISNLMKISNICYSDHLYIHTILLSQQNPLCISVIVFYSNR